MGSRIPWLRVPKDPITKLRGILPKGYEGISGLLEGLPA